MIIGNARCLMLDEITTGLDAAAALDIVRALRKWTAETGGSIVTSLLQPAPEVSDTIMLEGNAGVSPPAWLCSIFSTLHLLFIG